MKGNEMTNEELVAQFGGINWEEEVTVTMTKDEWSQIIWALNTKDLVRLSKVITKAMF